MILTHTEWFVCVFIVVTLIILFVLMRVRPIARITLVVVLIALALILLLFRTKTPAEGAADFHAADTIRIIMIDHGVLAAAKAESGKYPPSGPNGLVELQMFHSSSVDTQDSWKRSLRYEVTNGTPRITSAGADGVFDTADDIVR